jgi:hypothetical protein
LFPSILFFQKSRLEIGVFRRQCGQPCQKHPSTKTAIRSEVNKKSGLPSTSDGCFRQPRIPKLTSVAATRISVERFPLLRILDIRSDRSSVLRGSNRLTSAAAIPYVLHEFVLLAIAAVYP